MAGTIVAVGGGELRLGETMRIDRHIVALTGKERPRALFLPTASGDASRYIDAFWDIYGDALKCRVDTLAVAYADVTEHEIEDKILGSDLVYVGGGNTQKMMQRWRQLGVDRALIQAWEQGAVLCGLSAGSICWFSAGYSDSDLVQTGEYSVVEGLGLIDLLHCPHYDERPEFDTWLRGYHRPALAIDNNAAVIFQNNSYAFINSDPYAGAWRLWYEADALHKTPINNTEPLPLAALTEY